MRNWLSLLLISAVSAACGHAVSNKVGLMSFGDLQGKVIPPNAETRIVEGSDCGYGYTLASAARDALKETTYDTLIDVHVTSSTGFLVSSNCLKVRGEALDSKQLSQGGGTR